ncbi:Tetratricopeptide repeat-containing protein [Halpernia humi]|uniref:Tetratricopeptide repeat-containing protein n=1 Tax=Halpernia humi TaxID=493375 RepID=A0A1H5SGL7_9FLAO|nr:tetratricopeptide repeat-containing sensor histidine kinase [Halpernia humi]SEF49759.1 Tetratricopeptide repeat-containing protein [Halpernia humi]
MNYNIRFLPIICIILFSCEEKNVTSIVSSNLNYEKAWDLLSFKKNNDSAFYYFNLAKLEFDKINDKVGAGKSLMNAAIIQSNEGDYFGSDESSTQALKYFNETKDKDYIVSVYNAIAISRNNLEDYKTALIWYEKALKVSKDSLEKIKIQNNIAVAYSKLKDYKKSIEIFESLLNLKLTNQDKKIKSKIIDNLAFTKFLQNKNYNAEPELNKALKIREKENDLWGQNASHAHLADYFKEKNPEKSLFHAHKMYEIAGQLKSPDDEIEALQKLVNLESTANSKKYFRIYLKLNDSMQTARNKAKNQFALVRYESEKNRADLLKSQAENTKKNYQLLVRNVALGLAFLAIIISFIWFEKRRKRVKQEKELLLQEKELEVKNTELRYSKKVHDVVSNGVYQVMSEIENTREFNKEKILNKLEKLYEKSRDISYENASENFKPKYKSKISNLVESFTSNVLKSVIIGNEEEMWKQISSKVKSELLVILQELLVNMKKHSQAKKIRLEFEKNENQLVIIYSDDGIGFGESIQKKNGLKNMENRIVSCDGSLTFDETIEKGTKIMISFPQKFI